MKEFSLKHGQWEAKTCADDCVKCALPVYDPGCESTGPINPCQPCKPTPCESFRARDAIRIYDGELERSFDFRMYTAQRNNGWVRSCMEIALRRTDDCQWQWEAPASSVTPDGMVTFQWPMGFLAGAPGYYVGELRVQGKAVRTIYFYKPFMVADIRRTTAVVQPVPANNACTNTECYLPVDNVCAVEEPDGCCGGCDD